MAIAETAAQIVATCLQPLFQSLCERAALQLKPICGLRDEVETLLKKSEDFEELMSTAELVLLKTIAEGMVNSDENHSRGRDKEAPVRRWFRRLENVFYDADDVVDKWVTAELRRDNDASGRSGCCITHSSCLLLLDELHRDIAVNMKDLTPGLEKFNDTARQRGEPNLDSVILCFERSRLLETTSMYDHDRLYVRDKEKETLVSSLLGGSSDRETICVVGMGGIGKTTLAQLAFHNKRVQRRFSYRVWVSVPHSKFDLNEIGRGIIEEVNRRGSEKYDNLDSLLRLVGQKLQHRRFLLVLDGVWTVESRDWGELKSALSPGLAGSKILVTTQRYDVAEVMGVRDSLIIHLDLLTDKNCCKMLSSLDSAAATEMTAQVLGDLRMKSVTKCAGLPLIANALDSSMRKKIAKREWEKILQLKLGDVQNKIFASFLLSYCHLSHLQRSYFLFCSIFPRSFEIERDDLIEMWISFRPYIQQRTRLGEEQGICLGEEVGCFNMLAKQNLFQDFTKDYDDNIIKCKMHAILHEFTHFLQEQEHDKAEQNSSQVCDETRHFTLILEASNNRIPTSVENKKKLRTLFVLRPEASSSTPSAPMSCDELVNLACLRTLYLCRCNIERLPKALDKLLLLRYLNLSGNSFSEIPDSLCDLFNLQTLRIKDCTQLRTLPDEIGRLKNLQHLYIGGCNSLVELPKGITRLENLRVLDMFIVADQQTAKALQLKDLDGLKRLKGKIHLYRCGNLSSNDLHPGAEILRDESRECIDLKLNFDGSGNTNAQDNVLAALNPHPYLKSLEIIGFNGTGLYPWMDSLRRVVLTRCPNWTSLPPLGKICQLESLQIVDMANVEIVGPEFLGIAGNNASSFQKLKELQFDNLPIWREWSEITCPTVMPLLLSLQISHCRRLQELPAFLWTKEALHLTIKECHTNLKQKCCAQVTSMRNMGRRKIQIDEETITATVAQASSSTSQPIDAQPSRRSKAPNSSRGLSV